MEHKQANHDKKAAPPPPTAPKAATPSPAAPEAPKRTVAPRKVYISVGEVKEFKNFAEAEKYLNDDPMAPKDFTVIKGLKIEKKQRVSLR